MHSGVVPPYIIDGATFHLQEVAGPDPQTIAWLAPGQTLGIWFWQVRLFVRYNNLPDTIMQATWFLERDAIIVASWRRIHQSRVDPVTGGNMLTWETIFTDFTTFPAGATFNFSIVGATPYPP